MGVIGELDSCAVGCGEDSGRFRAMSSSIDNFFSDPEFIFHTLLQIFVAEQQAVTTLPAAGCGVGNVPPGCLPANLVALALHQRNEFHTAGGVAHTVVDDIHELQLLALTAGRRVIPVSYTHLDVYKRQLPQRPCLSYDQWPARPP